MTIKLILPFLFFATAYAQDASQEAIILNQEMQFLEDSVTNNTQRIMEVSEVPVQNARSPMESLEKTYFGENSEDSVTTRTAAPKRRGL